MTKFDIIEQSRRWTLADWRALALVSVALNVVAIIAAVI